MSRFLDAIIPPAAAVVLCLWAALSAALRFALRPVNRFAGW